MHPKTCTKNPRPSRAFSKNRFDLRNLEVKHIFLQESLERKEDICYHVHTAFSLLRTKIAMDICAIQSQLFKWHVSFWQIVMGKFGAKIHGLPFGKFVLYA